MNIEETLTYKEIMQQSYYWRTIEENINDEIKSFKQLLKDKTRKGSVKILLTGAGSSAYIGDFLERVIEPQKNITILSVPTTDILTDPERFLISEENLIVFSFGRSGNSPETKGVIELTEKLNSEADHVFITNNKNGFLAKYNRENTLKIILPEETNDKSLAMTSSFSTMLLSAALLFGLKLSNNFSEEIRDKFQLIENITDEVIEKEFDKIFYVGTGIHSKILKEISLKMNELSAGGIHINRESTLGFRHGPKAALTNGSAYIQLYSNDRHKNKYENDLAEEVGQHTHYHKFLLVPDDEWVGEDLFKKHNIFNMNTKTYSEFDISLLYLVFGQLVACKKSLSLGINPDNPVPDGFINRVVQGVNIYEFEE